VDTKKKKLCPQMLASIFINVRIVKKSSNPNKGTAVYIAAMGV
jgi:hypothetical protein